MCIDVRQMCQLYAFALCETRPRALVTTRYRLQTITDSLSIANVQITNKAIVDNTSPALCTPVITFSPISDAAYRQRTGAGPSHGHRQHAHKFGKDRACCSRDILLDRHTDTHAQTCSSQYFAAAPAGELTTKVPVSTSARH